MGARLGRVYCGQGEVLHPKTTHLYHIHRLRKKEVQEGDKGALSGIFGASMHFLVHYAPEGYHAQHEGF